MTHQLRSAATVTAAVVAMTLGLSGCNGDDEPKPIPTQTESPSPGASVSPPPDDTPELDDEQQAAFDAAVQRYAEYQEFTNRVWEEPSRDPDVALELAEYTVTPETKAWSDSNEGLIENDQHYSGSRDVEWTAPVEVSESRIHFQQCESPGDYKLHEGDEFSEATDNIVSDVYMVKQDGTWLVEDQEFEEEC
ncbi:hypothetical protein [Aeromicrobium sp. CTD01-1L150]|uniref:hypothetical protein n=1 Tax=Aeromicrobium sp. CTD01-1L150 TaxID=3341830 RepID=UPI0035C137EB